MTAETIAAAAGDGVGLERASIAAPRPELDWERDWQGRPRILADPRWTPETAPPGWVQDGAVLPEREYTRVTTHAEALQDASALTRWKMRRVAIGMSRRPDYVTAAAALTTEDRDRDALDDIAEKALEASGPNAADIGTALHGFTERIDRGEDVGVVPPAYASTLEEYRRAVAHLTFLEYECRTVCDELEAAGTPDRVGLCDIPDPDGETEVLRIIDTKTGRVDYSAGKFSTQLAIYRRSDLYHPGTGVRTGWKDCHGLEVSRWGLVVHAPAGAGFAELLWIDLAHGDHGGELAAQVRDWRKGAKASVLLRPVFARAPRPRPQDGTCRGRRVTDGAACGYRRKAKADGLGEQFCGRHQDQAADLERWLAENPGTDPDAGVEEPPSRRPVQPSSPAVLAEYADVQQAAADDAQTRADDARQEALAEQLMEGQALRPGVMLPNGHVTADPGALCIDALDRRWVKVQRSDSYGWERVERVLEAGGPELVRCAGTDLLVTQCACSVHRPELVSAAAELQQDVRPDGRWEEDEAAADGTDDVPPARELTLDSPAAGMGHAIAEAMDRDTQRVVGTYALDPATEVNGNPRPVSGLQTPQDAQAAVVMARDAAADQIEAAVSESELLLIYRQHAGHWTDWLTRVAGARSRQLAEQQARARPGAALLSALETAPDVDTLSRLWNLHADGPLWSPEAAAVAVNRHRQLVAQAQL